MTSERFQTTDLVQIALFSVLMAVCAWISIPVPRPLVPFTLQTFAVLAALMTLGGRRGTCAVAVYLLLGAVGLPVFSGFQGGLGALLGATGGYISGFLAGALVYWLVTSRLGSGGPAMALGGVLALVVCYGSGTAWYMAVYAASGTPVPWMTALGWCVFPFVLPDLGKLALAMAVSRRVRPLLRKA